MHLYKKCTIYQYLIEKHTGTGLWLNNPTVIKFVTSWILKPERWQVLTTFLSYIDCKHRKSYMCNWVKAYHRLFTVEPILKDCPFGHKIRVSQSRWVLVAGSVALNWTCQEYVVIQDRRSLMAVASQDRFHCTCTCNEHEHDEWMS